MTPVDLVLLAGGGRTMDATRPVTDAVAVRGDRIVAVGDEARAAASTAARVVESGFVLPGFVDAHVHPINAGRNLNTVDLSDCQGVDEYLAVIGRFAVDHPDAAWITGGGWHLDAFPGGLPRREILDAVTGGRPCFLFNRDVHGAWLNTAALTLGGITSTTPDPVDGRIERDADGTATGCLHEGAAYRFDAEVVPAPSAADRRAGLLTATRRLHEWGVTSWQDAWLTPENALVHDDLVASGDLTARVVGAQWWERDLGHEQIDGFVELRDRLRGGLFTAGTVKIMVDGVLENRTGAMLEPYCGCGNDRGLAHLTPEALDRAVTELDRLGFQVHLHAIGDRAVRMSLDSVEAAVAANGPSRSRHHIAHVQVVDPQDLPRFAALDVTATLQTYWAQHEPQMDDLTVPLLGADRSAWQYPFADLHRSGADLAMGSDWPVSTADPLQQLEVAVQRRDPADRGGPAFLPSQALSLDTALHAFTAGSARVNHDDEAGIVTVGARADLVLLDRDPFTLNGAIADARVTTTVVAGRVVHAADGS